MAVKLFQFRRGTAAVWAASNPVLSAGEPGVELDTGVFKLGDGATPWAALTKFLRKSDADVAYAPKADPTFVFAARAGNFTATGTSDIPLVVKGASGQAANMFEVRNNGNTPLLGANSFGGLLLSNFGVAISGGALYGGTGAPPNGNGSNGDFFLRTDTPGTANQRLYVKSAGVWVGIA